MPIKAFNSHQVYTGVCFKKSPIRSGGQTFIHSILFQLSKGIRLKTGHNSDISQLKKHTFDSGRQISTTVNPGISHSTADTTITPLGEKRDTIF